MRKPSDLQTLKSLCKASHKFFKWLKQHLRVKEFYGTSENAVKIQIYAAIIAYCLVAIIIHDMKIEAETYDVLRILSAALLVKMLLVDLLNIPDLEKAVSDKYTQLEFVFKD